MLYLQYVEGQSKYNIEKVVCSPRIPIPFKADRLSLRTNERWSKLVAQTHEQRIVWADNVQKLNRKDGKVNDIMGWSAHSPHAGRALGELGPVIAYSYKT